MTVSIRPLVAEPALPNIWTGAGFATSVVVWLGVTVLALLITTSILTLAKSVRSHRADVERERLEDELRPALRARTSDPEPGWQEWVSGLSEMERRVLTDLVVEDVKRLEGSQKERLLALGSALELEAHARAEIESRNHYRRLHGLKVLASIDADVDAAWLEAHVSDRRSEREAAVHVIASGGTGEDQHVTDAGREIGLSLLLRDEPLSVYGVDGLHALIEADPAPLLHVLADETLGNSDLLSQVLLAIQFAGLPTGDPPLSGVLGCLEHEEPRIRERTYHVLADYGWHPTVREQVTIDAVLSDPAVEVRSAAYRTFDEWGDDRARRMLSRAVTAESDDRARVIIARGLQRKAPQSISELKAEGSLSASNRSWADIKQVVRSQPDPLR